MTNDEAKQLFDDAIAAMGAKPAAALAMLDTLDAARPNSRQVALQRGLCLARLGRLEEAQECAGRLRGRLEEARLAELEAAIGTKRALLAAASLPAPEPSPSSRHAPVATANAATENVLVVESTFPVSTTKATVTGHIPSGVFHLGEMVTITSEAGLPLLAPIKRIGTADAPLKLVREGQRAVLLLEVEPHHVRPGGRIVSRAAEETHAKTMVVGAAPQPDPSLEELSPELLRIERELKSGNFEPADRALEAWLARQPESRMGHRLKAKLHLEAQGALRDTKLALEHIRRAYELGGTDDPAVIDTLAWALGENGEAEHGLRFLERQAAQASDPRAAAAMAARVGEYRDHFSLGHVWEFSDGYGDVVLETRDLAEAARALAGNAIPRDGKVRRDRVGEWRDIASTVAAEHPAIRAAYAKPARGGMGMWWAAGAAAIALGAVALFLVLR